MNQHRGGNRQTRPRVYCPVCGRSIAVTFNKHTGDAYIRSHVVQPGTAPTPTVKCAGSGQTVLFRLRNAEPYLMHDKPRREGNQ